MLPYFYLPAFNAAQPEVLLDEDNSRHIVQVLRMKEGEELLLTDGKGNLLTAAIAEAAKRRCRVTVSAAEVRPPSTGRVAIAISPVKNASRFEWFLEKATEVGAGEIIPLICDRTERQQVRADRLQHILVSAMLQSRQVWLPVLRPAMPFREVVSERNDARRMIAWLGSGAHEPCPGPDPAASLILIGPEGDFTGDEAAAAIAQGFTPVSLGHNRLRTETAGVVAATLLCIPR